MSEINKEDFLDLCAKFETVVRNQYSVKSGDSPYYIVSNLKEFKNKKDDIETIRVVRNLTAHKGKKYIEVTPFLFDTLEEIIYMIEHPIKAENIMIKNFYSVDQSTVIKDVIKYMNKNKISNVPVLEDKKLIGVFSENTIFAKLSKDEIIAVDEKELISDYGDLLHIDNHSSEYYDFVSRTIEIDKIRNKFNITKDEKRCEMLFVTENGKSTEKVVGIITPWDVMTNDKE